MDPRERPAQDGPYEHDAPLREDEVGAGDKLDDRVEEGEGLPGDDDARD